MRIRRWPRLFDELYAEPDFQKLLTELPGDTPFLLFPVRLETRFCRTRHFVRPAAKEWFSIFPTLNVPAVTWRLGSATK